MIPASRQRNYLQSALYVIVAGICATFLLERLLAYAESAEKLAMEATVTRLHSGLYARLALHVLKNEKGAIEALARTSPFVSTRAQAAISGDQIYARELNYLGEFDGSPSAAEGGQWYYDSSRNELVYLPKSSRFLDRDPQVKLPGIRFRVELVRSGVGYTGLTLRPAHAYRWDPPL